MDKMTPRGQAPARRTVTRQGMTAVHRVPPTIPQPASNANPPMPDPPTDMGSIHWEERGADGGEASSEVTSDGGMTTDTVKAKDKDSSDGAGGKDPADDENADGDSGSSSS